MELPLRSAETRQRQQGGFWGPAVLDARSTSASTSTRAVLLSFLFHFPCFGCGDFQKVTVIGSSDAQRGEIIRERVKNDQMLRLITKEVSLE